MIEKILLELGKMAMSYLVRRWLDKHGMDRNAIHEPWNAFFKSLGNHVEREIIAHESKKGVR